MILCCYCCSVAQSCPTLPPHGQQHSLSFKISRRLLYNLILKKKGITLGSLSRCSSCAHAHSCVSEWIVARQAPLSMGLSRQEHWGGLPFPPLRDLPGPGIEPESLEVSCIGSWIPYQCTTWGSCHGEKGRDCSWAKAARSFVVRGSSWEGRHRCVPVSLSVQPASTTWRSGRSFWASIWVNLMLLPQTGDWVQLFNAWHCLSPPWGHSQPFATREPGECLLNFLFFGFSAVAVQHSIVARLQEGIL